MAYVPMDRLPPRRRRARPARAPRPQGARDTFDAAGYAALLRRLREDEDDVVYAPAFERDLEQPIAGSIPVPPGRPAPSSPRETTCCSTGATGRACEPGLQRGLVLDLDPDERVRRLVSRHERFGKDPDAAVAWAPEHQRNADLVATTRPRADLVVPDAVLRSIGDRETEPG